MMTYLLASVLLLAVYQGNNNSAPQRAPYVVQYNIVYINYALARHYSLNKS